MLRKIYYTLPPSLRFLARRLRYLPHDIFSRRENLPPRGLIYTGDKEFVQQGKDWLNSFIENGLKKEDNFLDIGSGIGRIAIPLSEYLTGKYEGFDAIKKGVDWCINHISREHVNFSFKYVPLYNDLYNSNGIPATEYQFDYIDNSFDFACAISVFTHMLPEEIENYLRQAYRVMKNGGILEATFFILDEESSQLMKGKEFDFKYDYGHYALMDKNVKSANVAYQKDYLEAILRKIGFQIEHNIKGFWCGRPRTKAIEFQDTLIVKK